MTHHALLGHAAVPAGPGMCLAFVRLIIEQALDWPSHELYARYLVRASTQRSDPERFKIDPYAADLEASMRHLGFGVPFEDRQPGDIVFNHTLAEPYGHAALLYDRWSAVENNYKKYRPNSIEFPRHLYLTRLEDFPGVTLVARIPNGD